MTTEFSLNLFSCLYACMILRFPWILFRNPGVRSGRNFFLFAVSVHDNGTLCGGGVYEYNSRDVDGINSFLVWFSTHTHTHTNYFHLARRALLFHKKRNTAEQIYTVFSRFRMDNWSMAFSFSAQYTHTRTKFLFLLILMIWLWSLLSFFY